MSGSDDDDTPKKLLIKAGDDYEGRQETAKSTLIKQKASYVVSHLLINEDNS